MSLISLKGARGLFFTTLLDSFEEIDDGTSLDDKSYDREYWNRRSKWTVDVADVLLELAREHFSAPALNYLKYYIAISADSYNCMWLHKRTLGKSLLSFRISQAQQEEAVKLLDERNITYVRKAKSIRITVDREMVEENRKLFSETISLVKKSLQGG